MSHANAALAPVQRLRIARLIVDEGWPVAHVALFFHVSWPTAKRWADRYAAMGRDGIQDRSSRPFWSPNRTSQDLERKIRRSICHDRQPIVKIKTDYSLTFVL